MGDFKSIIIPEEVIICAKTNGQAFAAPADNEQVIEQARSWAQEYSYDYELKESLITKGQEYRYKNGEFEFELKNSAGSSYNGGKLSFWNCIVSAPDGNKFVIGINQTLLCDLLQNCTLINGKVQGKVWLGREKTNTGVYVETMPQFKQAREELKVRKETKNKTVKYQIGDIVRTLTETYLYCGVVYVPVMVRESYGKGWDDRIIAILQNNEYVGPYHLYVPLNKNGDPDYENVCWNHLRNKKTSYSLTEKHINITTEEIIEECFNNFKWYELALCLSVEKDKWAHSKEEIFQKYSSGWGKGYTYTLI